METKLFSFNLPSELKEHLEKSSKERFTNISQYLIDLIVADKKNKQSK